MFLSFYRSPLTPEQKYTPPNTIKLDHNAQFYIKNIDKYLIVKQCQN